MAGRERASALPWGRTECPRLLRSTTRAAWNFFDMIWLTGFFWRGMLHISYRRTLVLWLWWCATWTLTSACIASESRPIQKRDHITHSYIFLSRSPVLLTMFVWNIWSSCVLCQHWSGANWGSPRALFGLSSNWIQWKTDSALPWTSFIFGSNPDSIFKVLVHLIRGRNGNKRVEEILILNATKSGCTTLNLQRTCHNVTRQR